MREKKIKSAHKLVQMSKASNVEIVRGDITHLDDCADKSADGVISTMALLHLLSFNHLRACFKQIRRVRKPGGEFYLADFGRLNYLNPYDFFAHMHEASLPPEVGRAMSILCERRSV